MSEILKPFNICFLGRTGNGKSSLINSLFNVSLMTDPLVPCTKNLSISTVLSDQVKGYDSISAYDTPGIGEFSDLAPYQRFYQYAVNSAHCIVLVTTLDRVDAPAQRLMMAMKEFLDLRKSPSFVVALNHIDSRITIGSQDDVVWDDFNNQPTAFRASQIQQRVAIIKEKFEGRFLPFEVVPVSALRGYGIEALKRTILK